MDNANLKGRLEEKAQGTQEVQEPGTAVIPASSEFIGLNEKAAALLEENLKNQPISYQLFDVIKSPSGGITSFSVQGISGEEMEKELRGIIIDYSTPRAYWDTPDPVEGTPPVCHSRDSVMSSDGRACVSCPFNDFGSKNGGKTQAKACKEAVQILLLRPNSIIPVIVRVPVSSKLRFQQYMMRLTGGMLPLSGAVTKITLEKSSSKGGKPFAMYKFELAETLNENVAVTAKAFAQRFKEILSASDDVPALDVREAV